MPPDGLPSDAPPNVQIARLDQPPTLRNLLSGEPEARFARVDSFLQRRPGDGTPASLETTAYLAYDARHLYIAFLCRANPEHVRAHLAPREEISDDDRVAVYLDPFLDRQQAYVFQASAAGVQRDAIRTEGGGTDKSFDAVWQTEAHRTAFGYAVLMTIPFRALHFPEGSGPQRWGIALERNIPRRSEEVTWPHITQRREGFITQFAVMTGLHGLASGLNVQLIPYVTHARGRFRSLPDEVPPSFEHARTWHAGFDVKAQLYDAYALSLALNPDFSQIAPDAPQVTVNRRFEVTFSERRPFFTENAAVFDTPLPLFYSRRIVNPRMGVRLVGKTQAWTLGGLVADDHIPSREVSTHAYNAVLRAQRRFAGATGGGLLTIRQQNKRTNAVAALDGRHKIGLRWVAEGQAALATRRASEGDWRTGLALYADLERDGRHFSYEGKYQDLGSDFHVGLGRVRRARLGTRQTEHEASYRWRPGERVISLGPEVDAFFNWSRNGQPLERDFDADFEVRLIRDTEVQVGRSWTFERVAGRAFRRRSTDVSFESEWLEQWEIEAELDWGTDLNRDPAEGAPVLGRALSAEAELTYRPTSRLRIDGDYLHERLTLRADEAAASEEAGALIFATHRLRLAARYQFTRSLSLRATLDGRLLRANPTLINLKPERNTGLDLLLTYQPEPFTAVYLGFTDRYDNLSVLGEADRGGTRPPDDRLTWPRTLVARQLFLKISYLIR